MRNAPPTPREARDYEHPPLDQEVTAIGGRCAFTNEARLTLDGREVLYLVGYGVFDASCCGEGGCGFAWVPGFVLARIREGSDAGPAVTRVEPVRDPDLQRRVDRAIRERESVTQVNFL